MEQRDPSPTGTKLAGYAGPEEGPFKCGNCVWFESGASASYSPGECAHPKVRTDPQLAKAFDGDAIVNRDGCCEYQRSKGIHGNPMPPVAPYKSSMRRY